MGNASTLLGVNATGTYATVPDDFLRQVETDGTLSGSGTSADPLEVAVPLSAAQQTKIDALPNEGQSNAGTVVGFDTGGKYAALPRLLA